jgi:hypothetical protein
MRRDESSPGDPHKRHAVRPFVSPAHLSLLGHAVADDLVHRGLGDAAADRQALTIPIAIVGQRVRVVPQVARDGVQVPSKRAEFIPFPRQQPTVQCLDPLHSLAAFAMPDQPLGDEGTAGPGAEHGEFSGSGCDARGAPE